MYINICLRNTHTWGGKAIKIVSFHLRSKVRRTSWASDPYTLMGLPQGNMGFNALLVPS